MLSVNGFRAALRYLTMFKEGMICTVSLSFLTVVFGASVSGAPVGAAEEEGSVGSTPPVAVAGPVCVIRRT